MVKEQLITLIAIATLTGCAHHPADCAIGIPWSDCLEGTAGYNNGGGSETRLNALKLEDASKQAAPKDDMYSELKKLKDLLDTKAITQDEYDTQKKKILDKYK